MGMMPKTRQNNCKLFLALALEEGETERISALSSQTPICSPLGLCLLLYWSSFPFSDSTLCVSKRNVLNEHTFKGPRGP